MNQIDAGPESKTPLYGCDDLRERLGAIETSLIAAWDALLT